MPKIDVALLPKEEAIDLAIDLYPVDHELALRVLKSALKDDQEDHSFEIAMARITVTALQSKHSIAPSIDRDESSIKSTAILIDERLQRFINATKLSLTAKTAVEVLALSEHIEESSEKLFILRKWIDLHRAEQDVLKVVETAISQALLSNDFCADRYLLQRDLRASTLCAEHNSADQACGDGGCTKPFDAIQRAHN